MRSESDDDRPWFWIGLRFGLGFWLAGALFSIAGALITWTFVTQQIELSTKSFDQITRQIPRPPTTSHVPPTTVTIPPRSVEACKDLTGGQINEDFARCRRGYTETR